MAEKRNGFEILEGFPPDVVAVVAHGTIGREDYEKVLEPLIEERIRQEGKVKLIYVFAEDFEGLEGGAAWEDMKLGLRHLGDFAKIAVVADQEWVRLAVKLMAALIPGEVRVFHRSEWEDAVRWICQDRPVPEGPVFEAEEIIPPLEDRIPPLPD